jgi:hypothetical protein
MAEGFAYRQILGKSVHRYGISASYGLDEAGVREAIELGVNYIFWSPAKKFLKTIIKDVVAKDRWRSLKTWLPAKDSRPSQDRSHPCSHRGRSPRS